MMPYVANAAFSGYSQDDGVISVDSVMFCANNRHESVMADATVSPKAVVATMTVAATPAISIATSADAEPASSPRG
jgi:uncharacterized OB-fold protein